MLTLADVTKSFGARQVLAGIGFDIRPGESVALIGANGSGKTTTLRCIAGLARPDAGRILVAGVDAQRQAIRARTHLSYLPQKAAFPATLTVRETLEVVARLRNLAGSDVEREIEACALREVADRSVGQLSGGERQRLGLAVALLPRVDLYLFDEPSANLDPAASRILVDRARQLKREGRTLLFTTHVPADVRYLATRVLRLADGRIAGDGATAFELRRYERMLEGFIWSHDDDDALWATAAGRGAVDDGRLHEPLACAAAGAARPR